MSKKLRFTDGIYEYTFEEVFEKYKPFIKKRALLVQAQYPNMISFEDALSNCNYGFWKAYEDYDHEKKVHSYLMRRYVCGDIPLEVIILVREYMVKKLMLQMQSSYWNSQTLKMRYIIS